MGTTYTIRFHTRTAVDAEKVEKGIKNRLELVNNLMSNWVADSDISRFNAREGLEPVTISEHTARVIRQAMALSNRTEGAFDPTVSPLIELWGFGTREPRREAPSDDEIRTALARCGMTQLRLDENLLTRRVSGLTLNLSAIAKGYAIDLVADYLTEQGITDFMVDVGGDMRVKGANPEGVAWRIGIEKPEYEGQTTLFRVASLRNVALATSGDYRNFFEVDGVVYSHVIDPRNGWPVKTGVASASVIAPNCATADALATTLMVLSAEAGLELVESMESVECLLQVYQPGGAYKSVMSSGMTQHLVPTKD